MRRSRGTALVLAGMSGIGAACGGGGTTNPPPPPPPPPSAPVIAMATPSGNAQSAPTGSVLPNPLRVIVTRSGTAVSGQAVSWAITPTGGGVNPASTTTGGDGIAATTVTLPPVATTSTITATAPGVTGSPVSFTAISAGAGGTATVSVINFSFDPDDFQIRQGGTVTFLWGTGSGPHTVTPVAPNTIPVIPGDPATRSAPFMFDVVFPSTGTYRYFCRVHGAPDFGMHGTVRVVQ